MHGALKCRHPDTAKADDGHIITGSDRSGRTADPYPVVTPQLTSAAASNGTVGSILTTEARCTTKYGEKVPRNAYG